MKLADALNILGVTGEAITLDQVKDAYRRAALKFHPDRNPGGLEMMKAVNAAWDYLKGLDWADAARPVNNEAGPNADYGDALNAAINAAINLEGIDLELIGAWIWVTGNSYPHRATLKAAGFRWASAKMQWYFRPAEWASAGRGSWSMDKIRASYGSSAVPKPKASPRRRMNRQGEEEAARPA